MAEEQRIKISDNHGLYAELYERDISGEWHLSDHSESSLIPDIDEYASEEALVEALSCLYPEACITMHVSASRLFNES